MQVEEVRVRHEGCVCTLEQLATWNDFCVVCLEVLKADEAYQDSLMVYCTVCDGAGHTAGEYGELCLANGRAWFEPSDPRDIYDGEDYF
jgi:hypothetical protein